MLLKIKKKCLQAATGIMLRRNNGLDLINADEDNGCSLAGLVRVDGGEDWDRSEV